MFKESQGASVVAPVALFLAAVLLIAATAGCSSSDPSAPTPSPSGVYVSGNGLISVGSQTATMMISIAPGVSRAPQVATGLMHIGVNDFENLVGTYAPESDNQVALTSAPGAAAADPYVFIGKLEGSTITGTLSGGSISGTEAVSLAATSVPIEAVVLLGPWDFSHEITIETASRGVVDPCPIPGDQLSRTITDSCQDRFQVEVEGNLLPANTCNDTCLPDLELTTGSLDGSKLTLHIPEVDEPTTPAGRLFSKALAGCNIVWTGQVEMDFITGNTQLVNLQTQCLGSGDSCDPYCTDGQLSQACVVNYELDITRCVGASCDCPK